MASLSSGWRSYWSSLSPTSSTEPGCDFTSIEIRVWGLEFSARVSYIDFLTRVKRAENETCANGSWNAPPPWFNMLLSSPNIVDFDRNVFKEIMKEWIGGPMLVYPMIRSK